MRRKPEGLVERLQCLSSPISKEVTHVKAQSEAGATR